MFLQWEKSVYIRIHTYGEYTKYQEKNLRTSNTKAQTERIKKLQQEMKEEEKNNNNTQ